MKKISLIALSLLVISFIGYCKTNAQEKPNVTGASGVEKPNPDQIPENRRPKLIDPNAPKDYVFEDAVREIPYVTDDGKNRSVMMQRRLQEVMSLSDKLHLEVNDESLSSFNGYKNVLLLLEEYEEKLKELPNEIEWRDKFIEKTKKSRHLFIYLRCKDYCSKLEEMLRDIDSSPLEIFDFMDELVPYVKNYPDTALYLYFQKNLRNYGELIAEPEITSKYPIVASHGFLNILKIIGNTYNIEFVVEPLVFDAINVEASSWEPSSSRKAGTRQTLKIGNAEYGFVWIPAGEFDMGSPESEEDRGSNEVLHHVKLTKGFWMLETEVTQALYQEIMGGNPSNFKGDDLPVENVSWHEAMEFCKELTTRLSDDLEASLPTEAQWEYSCRAGTKTAYWYGDVADSSMMTYNEDKTTLVKSYKPNPWGLYDMHGNVWEWTSDDYGDYPSETVTDPKAPSGASNPVIRGGAWYSSLRTYRSAFRYKGSAYRRGRGLGFRFLLSCD